MIRAKGWPVTMTYLGPSGGREVKRSAPISESRQIRPKVLSAGLLPALLLGLAACGSSGGSTSEAPAGGTVIPAADLCAYLKQELLPKLQQEPSQYSAMMDATSAISKFYQQRNALQFLKATDLDAATELACPAVRTAVLKAIGQKNLRSV
jgi:hypothetical protein